MKETWRLININAKNSDKEQEIIFNDLDFTNLDNWYLSQNNPEKNVNKLNIKTIM